VKNRITASVSIFVLIFSFTNLFNVSVSEHAFAATTGSGNCVQTVNNSSGVSVYEASGYCYVAFKDVGSRIWTVPSNALSMDYLVVAGGGGGGGHHSGGGGAGGLRQTQSFSLSGRTEFTITVGDGGAGGVQTSGSNYSKGSNGTASSLVQTAGSGSLSISATGGGGGSTLSSPDSANTGGSGGGNYQNIVAAGNAGGFSPVEGYAGGIGTNSGTAWSAGGGGGASNLGNNSTTAGIGGAGGAGQIISWISTTARTNLSVGQEVSSSVYFAGGGGGGATNNGANATGGSGGNGGGGAGTGNATSAATAVGVAGTSNSGGGGGGSGEGRGAVAGTNHAGGKGGSGVVVIRYIIPVSTFAASDYTAGSINWSNAISGATSGTAARYGMTKTSSGPSGVVFAGKEPSDSDQVSSTIGSTSSLDTVTVEMWLKLKDSGSDQNANGSMLFSWNTSPNNYNIYHYGNQVGFNTFNSQLYGIDSTSYNNTWTHFVFVMTDAGPWSSQKVYVNGSLQASTCRVTAGNCSDAQARTFASNGNFLLMDHPYATNTWNAKSDVGLVRIYNQEISAASVQSLYDLSSADYATGPGITESSFSLFQLAGGATSAAYRTTIVITATVNVASKITFRVNGKVLPGCKNKTAAVSGSDYTATCSWRPSNRGSVTLTALATPTGAGISSATAPQLNIRVGNRTGAR
jgi:hypothetical protein